MAGRRASPGRRPGPPGRRRDRGCGAARSPARGSGPRRRCWSRRRRVRPAGPGPRPWLHPPVTTSGRQRGGLPPVAERQRRGGRDGQGHDNAQAAGVSCLRTSTEERWHHGYRHASLVGENPEEQRQFRPRHSRDGVRHYGCCSSGEGCGGGPSRQIRGSRLALNERSAEREIPDSAKSSMSERRRPAAVTVSRGVVKNRSRKDSSVSSLPSVCSTACWLIAFLPQTT